ncbi:hypothetical protein L6164_026536 [Bauhinia variegata]|uniref:Uncharacterized protein n=1 Tax=Bauhinia variegata TaxID=167791 RepID=A0ACB9LQG6_BAUVA|nr:hypothetical protein L6164_026536 [Bauhinia variegata]
MSKYRKNLPNPVFLVLPNGEKWEVNWVKHDGDVYFQKGWKEFAEHYSLAHGHFLVFKYEGKSRFYVHIFDTSALEISYPMVKSGEISHECPPRKRKRSRSPIKKSHQSDKMRSSLSREAKSNLKQQSGMSKLHLELDFPETKGGFLP